MISKVVVLCFLTTLVVGAKTYPPPMYSYPPPPEAPYKYMAPPKYSPPAKEEKPQPYEFNYDFLTDDGASVWQQEESNNKGEKSGTYGYKDAYGVYRYVDYWADANGFRAKVKTNEPGTANQNPADVEIMAKDPPAYTAQGKAPKMSYKSPEPSTYKSTSSPKAAYKTSEPPTYKSTKSTYKSPPPPPVKYSNYETPPPESYESPYPPPTYEEYSYY